MNKVISMKAKDEVVSEAIKSMYKGVFERASDVEVVPTAAKIISNNYSKYSVVGQVDLARTILAFSSYENKEGVLKVLLSSGLDEVAKEAICAMVVNKFKNSNDTRVKDVVLVAMNTMIINGQEDISGNNNQIFRDIIKKMGISDDDLSIIMISSIKDMKKQTTGGEYGGQEIPLAYDLDMIYSYLDRLMTICPKAIGVMSQFLTLGTLGTSGISEPVNSYILNQPSR